MEWLNDPLVWSTLGGGVLIGVLATRIIPKSEPRELRHIREENRYFSIACHMSRDAIFVIDEEKTLLYTNPAAERLYDLKGIRSLRKIESEMEFYLRDEEKWLKLSTLFERHRLRRNTETSHFNNLELGREKRAQVSLEIQTIPPSGQGVYRPKYVLAIHDTSCEKKLFDLHHINTLSGLPNQYKAYSDITALTSLGKRNNRFAVIIIELDEASKLRSLMGYAEMDTIITHIANSLRELGENPRISVYHLHYVNFMIVLEQPDSIEEIYSIFDQFQLHIREHYNILQNKQKLTFSAGVSLYPNNSALYSLINNAFAALTKAQEEGRGHLVLASQEMDRNVDHELMLNTEIEKGLQNREFKLYFQPLYDTKDQSLAGAEVLLRWHHPERGLIMPDLFVPIAEKSGLILNIGKYVIEESLKHLNSWHSFGFPPLTLSLNLSLRELESQEFMSHLIQMLYQYQIGDSRLKFEITEHTTMLNPALTHQKLTEIQQLGIGISLDDFGTGYSSFAHLAEFPIETLKIDRGFVTGLCQDSGKQNIVSTITKLGHSLGMTIVAEGVETKEEATMLTSFGVDYLQGYYFSRPLPQLEFQYLLSHS